MGNWRQLGGTISDLVADRAWRHQNGGAVMVKVSTAASEILKLSQNFSITSQHYLFVWWGIFHSKGRKADEIEVQRTTQLICRSVGHEFTDKCWLDTGSVYLPPQSTAGLPVTTRPSTFGDHSDFSHFLVPHCFSFPPIIVKFHTNWIPGIYVPIFAKYLGIRARRKPILQEKEF